MSTNLSWAERKALYRAGVRFPDPRDHTLRVRSVVLRFKQMLAREMLDRRLRQCAASKRTLPRLAVVR